MFGKIKSTPIPTATLKPFLLQAEETWSFPPGLSPAVGTSPQEGQKGEHTAEGARMRRPA